ncbi:hypothetical protein [Paraburkholderia phenoliruptrix]|uniref:hypothetical protein n=1 Tax=Paraburkholderia phenoliruptrix TaxID=252970 RepID=UPI0028699B4F|nr:hypothetical protein [Paraburkholderia phenoliruptrix]WMY06769.1 hypothetical protein P3F88_10705 [Paraburkholderia phenoliruptrix]
MRLEFDYSGVLAGKNDEQSLRELIMEADRDNAVARMVIARNDTIKAMAEHKLIGLALEAAEVE